MYGKYDVGIFPMVCDLLHVGHISALEEAKSYCNTLIVALNCNPCDDEKKHKPIESVYERYRRVASLACVDVVIPYEGEEDLLLLLQTTKYNCRFIGEDHRCKGWTGKAYEQDRGIVPVVIKRAHCLSSSSLRQRVYEAEREPMTVGVKKQ